MQMTFREFVRATLELLYYAENGNSGEAYTPDLIEFLHNTLPEVTDIPERAKPFVEKLKTFTQIFWVGDEPQESLDASNPEKVVAHMRDQSLRIRSALNELDQATNANAGLQTLATSIRKNVQRILQMLDMDTHWEDEMAKAADALDDLYDQEQPTT